MQKLISKILIITMLLMVVQTGVAPESYAIGASLSYDSVTFLESTANDGSTTTAITATLVGDTFVVTAAVMTEGTHYSIANVPSGLTAVVTGTSTTTATVALTGNADVHANGDDVSDLTLNFLDAAFTGADASTVSNSSKSDLAINYITLEITYDASTFTEVAGNDGSTTTVITATLVDDAFSPTSGVLTKDTDYSVANLPAGLTEVVTATSATTATIAFTGNATNHNDANDVSSFTLTLLDGGLNSGDASSVIGYIKNDFEIDFTDPSLTYDASTFTESGANDGSTTTTLTATLAGDTFVVPAAAMDLTTHYTVSNVPTGLTVLVTGTSTSTATITLTGNAASHINTDDISDLTINFTDAAFNNSTASVVSGASKADYSIDFANATISYDLSTFSEAAGNDGIVDTIITGTLSGDTYVIDSAVMTENTHYTISNLAAGLTAVVTGTGTTTATITITGNATSHVDGDDIADLTVNFMDAAFTLSTADIVINAEKADFIVDFDDPLELTYSGSAFTESPSNDGSIDTSITVTLTTDTFVVPSAAMTLDTHYSVANQPAGLTVVVTGTSATTATITFTGTADSHDSASNITNFTVNFSDAAFTTNTAADVANSSKADYTISFDDPTMNYSTTSFNEAIANDGSISTIVTLTLVGDTFVVQGGPMDVTTYYTIANVPAGLTVLVTGTSASTATVTLTGNATAHTASDLVNDLTITFLDAAFTNGASNTITNYNRSDLVVNLVDAFAHIVDFENTHIQYDEADGSAVFVAPTMQITESSKYIEFEITNATSNETIGITKEANALTGNGVISIVGDYVYLGDGVNADIIGGIDPNNNGENGDKLRITFSTALTNGNFLSPDVGSGVPGWASTLGSVTLGALASRSQGAALTVTGTGPYVMTKASPNGYSYTSDKDYGAGSGNHKIAWEHESIERPTGTLNTSVAIVDDVDATGGKALKLQSGGSVVSSNVFDGSVRYGAHFGPFVTSDTFAANAGDGISMDWKAVKQSDDYEVYGFLVNTSDDSHTLMFYGRGQNQSWTSAAGTIPTTGNYQFKFVNGTFDGTGGYAVGSHMWIDNIRMFGSQLSSAAIIQDISRLINYSSTEPDPESTRTLTARVENGSDVMTAQSATIHINNQYNHPPTLSIDALTPNFGLNTNSAVLVFDNSNASAVESGELITGINLTVATLVDGADEKLTVDGTEIILTDSTSGTTATNAIAYSVSVSANTATITLTHGGLTTAKVNTLLDLVAYNNTNAAAAAGNRTIKVIEMADNGGTANSGNDTATLNLSSQVTLKAIVDDFESSTVAQTSVSFTWTAAPSATALKIQQSEDGVTWTDSTHDALLASATSGEVTALTASTTYKFRLVVTGGSEAGNSLAVEVTTSAAATADPEPDPEPSIIDATIEEEGEDDNTVVVPVDVEVTTEDGETTVDLTFDEAKLKEALADVEEGKDDQEEVVIHLQVDNSKVNADTVKATLDPKVITQLGEKEVTLKIETDEASYSVPSSELDLEKLAKSFGDDVDTTELKVVIEISKPTQEVLEDITFKSNESGYTLVVAPVTFTVKSIYKDKTVSMKKFVNYVEREIAIPEGIDPSKITTAVTYKEDGTLLHIPTNVVKRGDKYFAKINSLTNSAYTLIYNEKTFTDIENHWAESTIINMASRLVVKGVSEDVYGPDLAITREEFVSIVTHAIGVRDITVASSFTDVSDTSTYIKEIYTALNYDLVAGYGNNDFKGTKFITREEAMIIMSKAVLLANKNLSFNVSALETLNAYADQSNISAWAVDFVAFCIDNDIVMGANQLIDAKRELTRAEAAQLVRNMLTVPGLIQYEE